MSLNEKTTIMNRLTSKIGTGGLVLAGLAAYAWYKYSRMSEQEKASMVDNLKEKGQKLYDEYVPENVKNMVGQNTKSATMGADSKFGEGSAYSS